MQIRISQILKWNVNSTDDFTQVENISFNKKLVMFLRFCQLIYQFIKRMLKSQNGRVLKPVSKPILGEREISFYENLQTASDSTSLELLGFTPSYYGTKEMQFSDKTVKFLELGDITNGMAEPCIMDIKIGKRTWDPLSFPEKKKSEQEKYSESKRAYGFCIPGFQVYRLTDGQLKKFGKDYGKKLNEKSIIEAIEIFLNASPGNLPNRDLILKILSPLSKILSFFRSQKKFRFYSSSLLIAYDAKRLRQSIRINGDLDNPYVSMNRSGTFSSYAPRSGDKPIPVSENGSKSISPESFSPPKTIRSRTLDKFQQLKRSLSSFEIPKKEVEKPQTSRRVLSLEVNRLCRTHSYTHNFDNDIIEIKEDYAAILAELCGNSEEQQNWVRVNMIDFTHVFPAEDDELDTNYLEGIENLIKLFETFLA
ncbi:inositol polyphosphate multikinase isoform X2 [Belonocnema kinseyi]|uniref:inositol polyphosphate multikinase isoform X2 n=1 Tax=Belonocnema kinseyi TaxID=2817044 RepID=UPI00143D4E33|nr:inositol polyphosphate multikinase isoform X2 [Belonocnema kinseyi]